MGAERLTDAASAAVSTLRERRRQARDVRLAQSGASTTTSSASPSTALSASPVTAASSSVASLGKHATQRTALVLGAPARESDAALRREHAKLKDKLMVEAEVLRRLTLYAHRSSRASFIRS